MVRWESQPIIQFATKITQCEGEPLTDEHGQFETMVWPAAYIEWLFEAEDPCRFLARLLTLEVDGMAGMLRDTSGQDWDWQDAMPAPGDWVITAAGVIELWRWYTAPVEDALEHD